MKIKDRARPALPPVPAGQYLVVCVGVYDLGEQYSEKYKNYSPKIMITFDIPAVTIEVDGKQEPRQLSKEFTISGKNNSKLRAFISSWNGVQYSDEAFGEFDPLTQVGKPAMINVLLNETGEYSNIDGIAPLPVGLPIDVPQPLSPLICFDADEWDDARFEALPDWAKERIKKSTQYQKMHAPVETVAVQGVQQVPAAVQMPQNIPGINFQAVMQQMAAQTQAAPVQQFTQNAPIDNTGRGECPI